MAVLNRLGRVRASTLTTANGSVTLTGFKNAQSVSVTLDVTTFAGTNPTLNVSVTYLDPVSGKDITVGSFTQVGGATSTQTIALTAVAPQLKFSWTIGGTASPAYTFALGMRVTELL